MTGWMSGKLGEDLDCERENELSGRRKVGWRKIFRMIREQIAHWMVENILNYQGAEKLIDNPKIFRMIREQIAHWMEATLDDATDPWGVKVERVEM